MANGFQINKRAIEKMSRDLEREFAKHPVRIPLQADTSGINLPAAATVNNYHGPVVVVHGNNAQLAWNNGGKVSQSQDQAIASGYEDLTRLITDLLANLDDLGLAASEADDVRETAETVLGEVVKEQPDKDVVRKGITLIKGALAPIAAGIAQAATSESSKAAVRLIEHLGNALPS